MAPARTGSWQGLWIDPWIGFGMRILLGCLFLTLSSCQMVPDEFNLSPIYRHRVAPNGEMVEMDLLWPIFHWEKEPDREGTDFRVRPLWRTVTDPERKRVAHQFLVPLGGIRSSPEKYNMHLWPLFYYKEHWNQGIRGSWDVDWMALILLWGGASYDERENYFAFIPFFGKLRNFLTYDELGFVLFPLYLWTERERDYGRHILWPLTGWGGQRKEGGSYWWRILPFFGKNVRPGRSEHYTALFPFFWWGWRQLQTPYPVSYARFWPLLGMSFGGAFVSWDLAWPLIRHAHLKEGKAAQAMGYPEGAEAEGRFVYWDLPWPLYRYYVSDLGNIQRDHLWITPFYYHTRREDRDIRTYLLPFLWFRHYFNNRRDRWDRYFLPFFWDSRTKYRKPVHRESLLMPEGEPGAKDADTGQEDVEWYPGEAQSTVYWPFVRYKQSQKGAWWSRGLALWPFDGVSATGVREAYDWLWTIWDARGDALGNSRTRTTMNVFTSRNFAGKRYQCSVPLLFNLESNEKGGTTLRLFQFIPISWGGHR